MIFVLDFETTGLNPYHDDMIECCIKVLNSNDIFTTLIKTDKRLSEKVVQITQITNDKLERDGLQYKVFLEKLMTFLINNNVINDNIYIVSHNGTTFDFIFLRRCFNDYIKIYLNGEGDGVPAFGQIDVKKLFEIKNRIMYIDTLLLSRKMLPNNYSFRQSSLLKFFGLKNDNEHRAFGDVLSLELLYNKLCEILSKECDTSNPLNIIKNLDI
jgi:DNA polymerase III alpha subunit (gram-positive type)